MRQAAKLAGVVCFVLLRGCVVQPAYAEDGKSTTRTVSASIGGEKPAAAQTPAQPAPSESHGILLAVVGLLNTTLAFGMKWLNQGQSSDLKAHLAQTLVSNNAALMDTFNGRYVSRMRFDEAILGLETKLDKREG